MNIMPRKKIPHSTSEWIMDHVRYEGSMRASDIQQRLQISRVAVHRHLRRLVNKDELKKVGSAPFVWYVLPNTQQKNFVQLEKIKKKIIPILKNANVKKAALFGSYVRGENTAKSDIDVLVDLPRGKTLLDLVGLQLDLEEVLKKKVDVVEYAGLKPRIKDSILQQQLQIL